MPKMQAVQVPSAKGPFQLVDWMSRNRLQVRCESKCKLAAFVHSDEYAKEGSRPGIQYPRIPGHEVAGIIDAVGAGVAGWEVGQRVEWGGMAGIAATATPAAAVIS